MKLYVPITQFQQPLTNFLLFFLIFLPTSLFPPPLWYLKQIPGIVWSQP